MLHSEFSYLSHRSLSVDERDSLLETFIERLGTSRSEQQSFTLRRDQFWRAHSNSPKILGAPKPVQNFGCTQTRPEFVAAFRSMAETTPLLRKNGLQWSCEPCRKSKHRCDHTQPVCGRCQRRNPQECTYQRDPMKGKPSKRRKISPPLELPTPPVSHPSESADVGFLGSTSFNAVFDDNQRHINIAEDSPIDTGIRLHDHILSKWRSTKTGHNSDMIFDLLGKFSHLNKVMGLAPSTWNWDSVSAPWVEDCQRLIQGILDKYDLTNAQDRQKIYDLLDANTRRPVVLPEDIRLRDFISHYGLRWETIGVWLTSCGLSLMCIRCNVPELEFIENDEQKKQQLLFRLLESSDFCLCLCDDANASGTDLGFWLTLDNCIFASQVLGDAHLTVWRKLGDISTMVFAQGLHQSSKKAPFWLREFRHRGLAYAYGIDKSQSTFVGRPPRISKRYCDIRIPVDLELKEVALEGEQLAKAMSKLDKDNWHKDDGERKSTFGPMFINGAIIREDILEMCLGPSQENIREKALGLIQRSKDTYASFPKRVQFDPEMLSRPNYHPSSCQIQAYLDNIYNEFMVRRFLVRQIHDDPSELVQLAFRILQSVVIQFYSRDELASGLCTAWSIVLYGLPAAGVLAMELLQLNVKVVSHAKIKQTLCTFISHLERIHIPGEGNYALAMRAWEILQHIMDRVLSTEPAKRILDTTAVDQAPDFDQVGLMDDFGVLDFSWLDQGHFDQTLWDGLNAIV